MTQETFTSVYLPKNVWTDIQTNKQTWLTFHTSAGLAHARPNITRVISPHFALKAIFSLAFGLEGYGISNSPLMQHTVLLQVQMYPIWTYPGHCTRVRGSWSHVQYQDIAWCDVILDIQISRTWLACKVCFHRSQTTSMEVYPSNTQATTCLLLACKYCVQTLVLEIHFCLRLLQFVSCGTQGSVDESEKEEWQNILW